MLALCAVLRYTTYLLNKAGAFKMQVKQSTIAQNNTLYFVLQKNNKLNTTRIVCTYFKSNAKVTQKNAQYVSGDLVNEQDVANTLQRISAMHNNATMQQL
jgi:hypothetical protein